LTPTVLDECSRWLSAQGYSPGSAAGIVNLLERLSVWMQLVGAAVSDIDEELLGRFVAAERSREVVCATAVERWGRCAGSCGPAAIWARWWSTAAGRGRLSWR
jgi:hypothetical protein